MTRELDDIVEGLYQGHLKREGLKEHPHYYGRYGASSIEKPIGDTWRKDNSGNVISGYQGGHWNNAINSMLRDPDKQVHDLYPTSNPNMKGPDHYVSRKDVMKLKSHMDKAIKKHSISLPEKTTLYRTMPTLHLPKDLSELKGQVLKEPGYMSTTYNEKVLNRIPLSSKGKKVGRITVEIETPKGHKVLPVGQFNPKKNAMRGEKEILFPRDTKYKVVDYKLGKDDRPRLFVEIVN